MEVAVIGVVVVIAIVMFRVMRPSPKLVGVSGMTGKKAGAGRAAAKTKGVNLHPYRAVSVICGPGACEEATALGERRFLTGQLKKLPLPGCTSSNCRCKFEHHADRRDSSGDQRAPGGLRSELYAASGEPERRTRRGRRKEDLH